MTALSLRIIPFHISGKYPAEVPDTAVQLISLCCPVLFQARRIDSLNLTIYDCNAYFYNLAPIGASLSEPHTYRTAVQNPHIYIYIYIIDLVHYK